MSKSKTVLEMTAAGLDAPWETTTPLMHRCCNDGVIQLIPLSSYAVLEPWTNLNLVEISHACFGHLFLQYFPHTFGQLHGCKSGEFGGHMTVKMNSSVSLLARTAFWNDVTMTSSLRSVVQALIGHFTIFSHTDCQDDSCQKLYKVV